MEEEIEPRIKPTGQQIIQIVLALGVLSVLVAILTPARNHSRLNARRASCQSNLKQVGLGFKLYVRDYDEGYPILVTGWADAVQPYLKSTQIFQCPAELNVPDKDPARPGYTDYWFNAKIAGVKDEKLENQPRTIIFGDGDSNNARYHLWKMPLNWQTDTKSPLYRHLDGANFAFADGHVKWFRAVKWENELDMGKGPTFRLKPRN